MKYLERGKAGRDRERGKSARTKPEWHKATSSCVPFPHVALRTVLGAKVRDAAMGVVWQQIRAGQRDKKTDE